METSIYAYVVLIVWLLGSVASDMGAARTARRCNIYAYVGMVVLAASLVGGAS